MTEEIAIDEVARMIDAAIFVGLDRLRKIVAWRLTPRGSDPQTVDKSINGGQYEAHPPGWVETIETLITMRQILAQQGVPSVKERQKWRFSGVGKSALGECPWLDPVADQIATARGRFCYDHKFTLTPGNEIPPLSDDVRRSFAELKELVRFHDMKYTWISVKEPTPEEKARWLEFPHKPDLKSLQQQRDWALAEIAAKDEPKRIQQAKDMRDVEFFTGLSGAYAIAGFTAYAAKQLLSDVARLLRRYCDLALTARQLGWQPHVWYVQDHLHAAIMVQHRELADYIARQNPEKEWDGGRARPVDWLIARLRITADVWRGEQRWLKTHLEDQRLGVLVDKREPELEPDLPLMRNWYFIQKALIERDGAAFNAALSERMPLLAAHFTTGGTQTPAALIDTHGIALCRLARQRNIEPNVNHVYLPMGLLDL
jgi:Immunity protein 49